MNHLMKSFINLVVGSIFVWMLTITLFTDSFGIRSIGSSEDAGTVDVSEIADGTYTGTGDGFIGPIEVEVTVTAGEITEIEIVSHGETANISDPAFENVPAAIIENNSTEVDVTSGATGSSNGIMSAVNDALVNAQ